MLHLFTDSLSQILANNKKHCFFPQLCFSVKKKIKPEVISMLHEEVCYNKSCWTSLAFAFHSVYRLPWSPPLITFRWDLSTRIILLILQGLFAHVTLRQIIWQAESTKIKLNLSPNQYQSTLRSVISIIWSWRLTERLLHLQPVINCKMTF